MSTFRIVWLLRNLSLAGKLCLRDDNITAFVHHPLPLQASMENVRLRARISRKLFLIDRIRILWGPCQPSVALRI